VVTYINLNFWFIHVNAKMVLFLHSTSMKTCANGKHIKLTRMPTDVHCLTENFHL
jgi:hypothetical protein